MKKHYDEEAKHISVRNLSRYEVALAVDARDVDFIAPYVEKLTPAPAEFLQRTPDNDYVIYYWDYVLWEGSAVDELLATLEAIRHALYIISEDDEIWKDVSTYDAWGTDEQFSELLDIRANIALWDDKDALEKMTPLTRKAVDIDWDTDEGEEIASLPLTVLIPEDIEDDEIADYLSDTYGFLVKSYRCVKMREGRILFDSALAVPWAKSEMSEDELRRYEKLEAEDGISVKAAFTNAVLSDTDDAFLKLISDYRHMTKSDRSIVDATLALVCGWTLPSLMKLAEEGDW